MGPAGRGAQHQQPATNRYQAILSIACNGVHCIHPVSENGEFCLLRQYCSLFLRSAPKLHPKSREGDLFCHWGDYLKFLQNNILELTNIYGLIILVNRITLSQINFS
jgi:hypothetical protein